MEWARGRVCFWGRGELYEYFFGGMISNMAWDKIFRRGVFDGRRYEVGVYYEDGFFMTDALAGLRGALLSDAGWYKYCVREGSIMTGVMSEKKYLDSMGLSLRMAECACREGVSGGVFMYMNECYHRLLRGKIDYGVGFMRAEGEKLEGMLPSFGYILREGVGVMGLSMTLKFALKKLLGVDRFVWLRLKMGWG